MTFEISKFAASGAFALGLAATPALATDADWDYNADGVMTEDEYNQGITENKSFENLDEDGDGNITREEFNSATFSRYDKDQSGDLSEDEVEGVYFDNRPEGPFGNKQLKPK